MKTITLFIQTRKSVFFYIFPLIIKGFYHFGTLSLKISRSLVDNFTPLGPIPSF